MHLYSVILATCLIVVAVVLRAADRIYYRDSGRVLRLLRLAPGDVDGASGYFRPLDPAFACFPFIWSWCDILAAVALCRLAGNVLLWVPAVLLVASRFRALQEASHTAVHGGLCRSRRYQWAIANAAVQWPLFRPDMHHRYRGHVVEHHRHPNELGADPNIARFLSVGVGPGMTTAQWRRKLLHPFTAGGLSETVRNLVAASLHKNKSVALVPLRFAAAATVLITVLAVGGPVGLLVGFLFPLLTVYPLFSWISLLAEHRWFTGCDAPSRRARECTHGRPTDYPGPLGWTVKHLVFPFSDHYHLAHSLYPLLRWNYLPAVDRVLKQNDALYTRYRSCGLLSKGDRPSALSELRDRLTTPDYPDVADWARSLELAVGKPPLVTV